MNNIQILLKNSFQFTYENSKKSLGILGPYVFKVYSGYCLYSLFESSIANLLCLETLRHGTSLTNFCKIQMTGADPNKGESGGESEYLRQIGKKRYFGSCKNHFFVTKDSTIGEDINANFFEKYIQLPFEKRAVSIQYSCYSLLLLLPGRLDKYPTLLKRLLETIAFDLAFFLPVLRFHIRDIDMQKKGFTDDETEPRAVKTGQYLSAWEYVGVTGSLRQGVNLEFFSRIKRHPAKFLLGTVQLITAVAVTAWALGYCSSPLSLITAPFPYTVKFLNHPAVQSVLQSKLLAVISCLGKMLIFVSSW